MLRCAPSRIRITTEDVEEAKQKFERAAAARSSTKPLQSRALNIEPILATALHELQIKNGPRRYRDDALVQASCQPPSSSALQATTEPRDSHSLRTLERTRHSIHLTRRRQLDLPTVRRSRSHSEDSGIPYVPEDELFHSPPDLTSTTAPLQGYHYQDSCLAGISSSPYQERKIKETESGPTRASEELAETGCSPPEQLNDVLTDQESSSPITTRGIGLPQLPQRRSSLAWNSNPKDDTMKSNSESSDSDTDESHSSVATRPRPLSNNVPVRDTSPLEDLANRLRLLGATPGLRHKPSSRSRSSSSNASPRLLSGDLFYDRTEDAASGQSRQQIPRRPHWPVQATRPSAWEYAEPLPSQHDYKDDFKNNAANQGISYSKSPSEFILDTSPLLGSALSTSLPTATTQPVTPHNARETEHIRRRNSVNHQRPTRTPRIRIYDDVRPASMQPQTPADLTRRHRTTGDPTKSVPSRRRMSDTARDAISSIVPSDSRYPSLQNCPSTYDLRSRVFISTVAESGRPPVQSTQARRRQMHYGRSAENDSDTDARAMEDERPGCTSHRVGHSAADALEATPPNVGRIEGHMR